MRSMSLSGGAARARRTASSPSSLPTISDARSVPTVRVFTARLRVSTPDIPSRPFASKYSATEGCVVGTAATSRATHPWTRTAGLSKFCRSTP